MNLRSTVAVEVKIDAAKCFAVLAALIVHFFS